jgi:hypothetical protein
LPHCIRDRGRHAMTSIRPESKDGRGGVEMTNPVATELQTSTSTPTQESLFSREGTGDGNKERASVWRRAWVVVSWTPPNCRWDPKKPPQFSMGMNVLFAFAAGCEYAFTVLVCFRSWWKEVSKGSTCLAAAIASGVEVSTLLFDSS